jgi:ectoine hydroxylase-related dioxygenase (phytanoyl-CoA dioxygenase family)
MPADPTPAGLTAQQKSSYEENGYLCPIRVFEPAETKRFLAKYMEYAEQNRERLEKITPRERYRIFSETHFVLPWAYEIATHPRILDAVESVLGPNFLVWNTNWFTKMVGDKTFISWHQDGTYWKLSPAKVVTAWVALTPSQPVTGCMRIVPKTHLQPAMPQRETANKDNALSRGQEIAVEVDEAHAVDLALLPGEMSLHNIWIVHGSNPNQSKDTPRIGFAIRYVSTEVLQESPKKPLALLVRGRDTYGHFEILPPPAPTVGEDTAQKHADIIQRIRASIT